MPLVGERAATVLIKKAVDQTGLVRVEKGAATARLACRIATAEISRLKTPQWALVSGLDPDSIALMAALRTRFAVFEPENNENQNYQLIEAKKAAIGYYLYGLSAEGKTDEAVKLAALLPSAESGITGTPLAAARDAGLYAVAYQFLSRVVSTTSDYDLYDNLLEIAPHLNKSGDTLNLIHEALGRPDLSASKRASLEKSLTNALLAGDRVDEAVEAIRALLKKDRSYLENRRGEATGAAIETTRAEILEQSTKLASLGALLGHDDWIDEGAQSATEVMRAEASLQSVSAQYANSPNAMGSEPLSDSLYFTAIQLANTLQQGGRISAAEQILSLGLRGAASRDAVDAENRKRQQNGFDPSVLQPQFSVTTESAYLSALVLLYSRVGRTADVLALFDTAPDWGASDLVDVTVLEAGKNTSLGVAAAEALLAAGRTDDARRVVMAFLKRDRGNDALYALLLKIEGPEHVLPKLDLLAKQDRFEERPLIWRAEALLQLGRLPEAETAARAAIAVDPSDGEEPHGDRMRGYEVLSKIRAARGDQTESAFFGSVVTAIRTAEHADDLYQAGLISRAIALYKEALTHFADAYCIQSRLAVDLAAAGKLDEAAAHYRRAYELMPGSFGRMESHCFGCEGAFRGPTPQKIAEQVFVSLIAREPKKPQVHYLLGYLREEENRPAEALTEFRRAADLDPDYINAWRHISELSTEAVSADRSRDTAALNLLRLDPGQQHITIDFTSVSDLSGLYALVSRLKNDDLLATKDSISLSPFARSFGGQYPPHELVYGLSATRAKVDRDKAEMLAALRKQGNPNPEQYLEEMRENASEAYAEANGPVTSPTGAVSRNAVLALVPSLLDQTAVPPAQ